MKKQTILSIAVWLLVCSAGFGKSPEAPVPGTALTIYNDNFAVVRESRQLEFDQGVNQTKFTDVASEIDPTSVNFQCLSAPGAVSVLEQNYEYDLVSAEGLLKRYIDKNVTVVLRGSGSSNRTYLSGRLLAALGGDLIVKSENNAIEIANMAGVEEVTLKELPDDLVTKPTLVWLVDSKQKGSRLCQVTYTTGKIGWSADYSAQLSPDETALDFAGWVTIDNKSGATYKDAKLKLIAGDVRRIAKQEPQYPVMMRAAAAEAGGAPAFEEKAFMEYHLYTLGRSTTINNNQVKQIEFIKPALGVTVKKIYIYEKKERWFYERKQQPDKVQTKIEFENTQANGLGIALPRGKVRVFKKDPADGTLEFVGEDEIDHTATKEKLSLYIGDAFDIVPEYTLLDGQYKSNYSRETHKIELRNRKPEPVTVYVDEKFPQGRNWTIDQATGRYEKRDARTVRFEVKIKADSTETIQYTATQTW